MSNQNCKCELAGFCERHQIEKTERQFALCKAAVNAVDCWSHWKSWEAGGMGATAVDDPIQPDWPCGSGELAKAATRQVLDVGAARDAATKQRYLGDHVEQALTMVGITKERVAKALGGCGGCGKRQAKLNAIDQAAREIVGGAVESGRETLAKILGG